TASEVVEALRAQNLQASGGALGQAPVDVGVNLEMPVDVQGRLSTPEQFADVVIRTDAQGHAIRVRDIGRVELGSQDYSMRGYFDEHLGVGMAVLQQPGSNALDTANQVLKTVEEASADFPPSIR